jgi:ferredoxin-thioredoxin reductase catalytic subunit
LIEEKKISDSEVDILFKRLKKEAEESGYNLNPDLSFSMELVKSLIINDKRYGYWACPCRLASGKKNEDLDIICPCDYRDQDLNEFGTCYCALYVSSEIIDGEKELEPIPDRRKIEKEELKMDGEIKINTLNKPVWRCKVCGYLCARDEPPDVCPICKVEKERFERFM